MNIRASLKSDGVDDATIAKFFDYHRANPEVWEWFEKFTLEAIMAGKKFGAKAIFERVRWEAGINKKSDFALNNNFTAYYARIFEIKYPQHAGYFEKRTIKGLKVAA